MPSGLELQCGGLKLSRQVPRPSVSCEEQKLRPRTPDLSPGGEEFEEGQRSCAAQFWVPSILGSSSNADKLK